MSGSPNVSCSVTAHDGHSHNYLPPSRKVQYNEIWDKITKFTVDHDHYCKLLRSLIVWMGLKCGFHDYQPKDVRTWFEKRWTVSSCEPHLHQRTTSKGANLLCYLNSLDLSVGRFLSLPTVPLHGYSGSLNEHGLNQVTWAWAQAASLWISIPSFFSPLACVCPPVCDWHGFILLPRTALAPQFTSDACLPACQKGWASFPKSDSCWPFRRHIPTITSENTDHPQLWGWWAGYGRLTEVPQYTRLFLGLGAPNEKSILPNSTWPLAINLI